MTDWSKLKVADLKEECKARDIPLTGLKLKQQYIDKLEEYEVEQGNEDVQGPDGAQASIQDDTQPEAQVNGHPDLRSENQPKANKEEDGQAADADKLVAERSVEPKMQGEDKLAQTQDELKTQTPDQAGLVSTVEAAEDEKPAELQKEDSQAETAHQIASAIPFEADTSNEEAVFLPEPMDVQEKVETLKQTNIKISEQEPEVQAIPDNNIRSEQSTATLEDVSNGIPDIQSTPLSRSTQLPSDTSTPTSSQIPPADLLEDQRRRRKRSLTPVPTAEETSRKKARLSNATEDAAREAVILDQVKEATQAAKEIRGEEVKGVPPALPSEEFKPEENTPVELTTKPRSPSPQSSRMESEERDVPPAIHPATSSIYIRNLKRPLHIPTLRSHVVSLARSPSSDDSSDPLTIFFLDSIRTHAFVSFTSISAASRVRTAMHETRFPDEAIREPLFVDYVPDDKVQTWIDRETGGNSFGGRAGGKRFEVVYEEGNHGEIEAVFQEVGTRNPPSRPSMMSRPSVDSGRSRPDPAPQGIHPDRIAMVSKNQYQDRDRPAPPSGPRGSAAASRPKPSNVGGVGFKALDDLFSSTTTKPKLYFKPVPEDVVQNRLDMFHGLRVAHSDMGRSGDEGMKRYSFERSQGAREEWVDKGPEFGYGRMGKDRLVGFRGRGGGGYRGRGGDSWRGGR